MAKFKVITEVVEVPEPVKTEEVEKPQKVTKGTGFITWVTLIATIAGVIIAFAEYNDRQQQTDGFNVNEVVPTSRVMPKKRRKNTVKKRNRRVARCGRCHE